MSGDLRRGIYRNFSQKETDELIEIWQSNNRTEWTDMTFDVIREILQERYVELPPQDAPVIKTGEINKSAVNEVTNMTLAQIYFSFNGRISLTTFWLIGALPILAFVTILALIDMAVFDYSPYSGVLTLLARLLVIWPSLALTIKRWHDRDKSGLWVLIGIIPFIGLLWGFIETGLLPGTKGPNRYGVKAF